MSTDELRIDAWIQHPSAKFAAHPMFESLRRWLGMTEVPDEIPLEVTVAALEAADIDRALISAWWAPEGAIISNEEVAQMVEAHPDLLVGVGAVDLSRPMKAVEQVRYCVEELGFKAIRALPWLWDLPPDDRRYYPVYVACVEMGVPFCLQVGHTGPLRTSEWGRPIPYLDHVALDFPELTIVAGHIGYPWTDEMIALARKYPNVYIDTSAYKPSRFPAQFVDYLRKDGRKKVLFGSNFPMIMPSACLAGLDELELDDAARERFLWRNAAEVFDLDVSQT